MIVIEKKSKTQEYKTEGVCLTISHSLDRLQIADILRTLKEECGDEAIDEVLNLAGIPRVSAHNHAMPDGTAGGNTPAAYTVLPCVAQGQSIQQTTFASGPFIIGVGNSVRFVTYSRLNEAIQDAESLSKNSRNRYFVARKVAEVECVTGFPTAEVHRLD